MEKVYKSLNALREKMPQRWLAMIPDDPRSNIVLFGTEKPTIEILGRLHERTSDLDSSILHLWREDAVSERQREDNKRGFRRDMLTAHGCVAFTLRYIKAEENIKVCALRGGRGLFLLQEVEAGAYRLISGDCFIDGFEDGRGVEVAQQLGLKEEDICII